MKDERLLKARERIDAVDKEMIRLFEERFEAVKDVIAWKMDHGVAVFDGGREDEIRKKNGERVDPLLYPYYIAWFDEMLKQSKLYQEKIVKEKQDMSE